MRKLGGPKDVGNEFNPKIMPNCFEREEVGWWEAFPTKSSQSEDLLPNIFLLSTPLFYHKENF